MMIQRRDSSWGGRRREEGGWRDGGRGRGGDAFQESILEGNKETTSNVRETSLHKSSRNIDIL